MLDWASEMAARVMVGGEVREGKMRWKCAVVRSRKNIQDNFCRY